LFLQPQFQQGLQKSKVTSTVYEKIKFTLIRLTKTNRCYSQEKILWQQAAKAASLKTEGWKNNNKNFLGVVLADKQKN